MLGENIKMWRLYRHLTQQDVAKQLDISFKTVSSWESNRTEPNMLMLEKLAMIFNCKKSDIIEGVFPSFVSNIVQQEYYLDDVTKAYAEEIKNSPGRRALLDAAKGMTEEDMIRYAEFIKGITNGNNKSN